MKPSSGKAISRRLKSHGRGAKGDAEERGDGTAEGVASEPDVGVWVEGRNVVVEVGPRKGRGRLEQ
jgi:hypothetical protein